MKKIIALVLLLVIGFGLCGCSNKPANDSDHSLLDSISEAIKTAFDSKP